MLECVVNLSEGRDASVIGSLADAGSDHALDVHSDPDHHRTVLTLGGARTEQVVRAVARAAVELIDVTSHDGAHPRIGAIDVVPFVALDADGAPDESPGAIGRAVRARDRFASWAADELALPCFLYGPERTLPEVRKRAFVDLSPEFGPDRPHPTAGACAVGARPVLVAYNVWLSGADLSVAREIAMRTRGPRVRALGLRCGEVTQVSCNLLEPSVIGPDEVYEQVEGLAREHGVSVLRAELVGLAPARALAGLSPERLQVLDLDPQRTIEARLARSPS